MKTNPDVARPAEAEPPGLEHDAAHAEHDDAAMWAFGDGGYCRIFGNRLAESSLMETAVATRWLFVYMLARADAEGRFRCATVAALARAANISLTEAHLAVKELEAPDPDSKTKAEGGKRIIRIHAGWQIVNYRLYRDYQTMRQRREAERKRLEREAESSE